MQKKIDLSTFWLEISNRNCFNFFSWRYYHCYSIYLKLRFQNGIFAGKDAFKKSCHLLYGKYLAFISLYYIIPIWFSREMSAHEYTGYCRIFAENKVKNVRFYVVLGTRPIQPPRRRTGLQRRRLPTKKTNKRILPAFWFFYHRTCLTAW